MAPDEESLQGWVPKVGQEVSLEEIIERAFDYRGDVTVDTAEGREVIGYLYNRNSSANPPFIQLFESDNDEPLTLHYSQVLNIRFTGRDTAAGQSYEAWKARKEAVRHADPNK